MSTKENDEEIKEVLPGFSTFDDYMKASFNAMKSGIKAGNSMPSGENFNYYACFPTFNKLRNDEMKRLMNIMQRIVQCTGAAGSMKDRDTEEKFELLIETNDILLDRANVCMDEEAGIPRKPDIELIVSQTNHNNYGSWNASVSNGKSTTQTNSDTQSIRLLTAKNIQRPQLSFKDKIDNSLKPWMPRIKDKPNALKPLGIYLIDGENGQVFCHPYEFELDKFSPSEIQMAKCKPLKFKSLTDTPLIVIEKSQDLKIMMDDLLKYKEIAVDLEHHSYRTFQGITCLMQISTRDTDYLIDTLTLRSELYILNEIFTNPSILKVFHGADLDIQWLQRDLSLYIVNMFDTHQAAKQLNLPYLSLAYLLKTHCNVDPNKHFQLADWRIRPLPEELMKYAREDTHYLLYIKDILQNNLIDIANGQINILKAVYDRSTDICKQIYEKPVCDENSFMNMYRKSHKMFNNKQLYALKELYMWRDTIARQEDDSTGYVLPNHMLINIAETLPREMQGILACCNPIPPLVRQHLLTLHKLILKAREQPLIKPVLEEDIRQRLTQRSQEPNSDTWIFSPHDISNELEVQANLPCLLNDKANENSIETNLEAENNVTVFDTPTNSDDEDVEIARENLRKAKKKFISPFGRYKLVIPMVAAQEQEQRAQKEKEEKEKAELEMRLQKKDIEDTEKSKERVHDFFLSITRGESQNVKKEINMIDAQASLNTMGGKKRRHEPDMRDHECNQRKFDSTTPKPSIDTTITRGYKNKRHNDDDDDDDDDDSGEEKPRQQQKKFKKLPIKSFNAFAGSTEKRKVQKLNNRKELEMQDMLPKKDFVYNSVDFGSFQGGSKGGASKPAPFQQKSNKDKTKKRKGRKKKKKFGI
ncbi:hypothetical protein PV328_000637 [Microctonus aethiopoides]|uniref:Exosome complex component 10 homolog n=1 Tax=Microctonus aethiopoides TaxID=144406 RepID=A0AA39FVX4_9HYME|nr:hypothetical protein PV328_000637 [Microctonus aethiopoides]